MKCIAFVFLLYTPCICAEYTVYMHKKHSVYTLNTLSIKSYSNSWQRFGCCVSKEVFFR